MNNYAKLKTVKLLAFVTLSLVGLSVFNMKIEGLAIFFIALPALLIPAHFQELSTTRIRSQQLEFGILIFIVVVAAALLVKPDTHNLLMQVTSYGILPSLFIINAHFYRKYKDFSEDKYIYFVVSMLAGFISILFYATNNQVMALLMIIFSFCQLMQWSLYYIARRQGKDQGFCAFELIIPSAAVLIGHLHGDIKSSVAVGLFMVFPISYYLYKGLIKFIPRMHLYSVFIQFLLYVGIALQLEDKPLVEWMLLLHPLFG